MKGRVRQFNASRDQNLSQGSSQASQFARQGDPSQSAGTLNQSQSSVFLRASKPPVCVNCVNSKLVHQKKQKERKPVENTQFEPEQHLLINKDSNNRDRKVEMKRAQQVDNCNKKAVIRQLNSVRSDKQFDTRMVQQTYQKERELQDLEDAVAILRKDKELRYRKEVHQQVDQEQEKKKQIKESKLEIQPDQCLISTQQPAEYVKRHGDELRKQVFVDKIRKQQVKDHEKNIYQKEQEANDRNLMKFLDHKRPTNPANPEALEELNQKKELQKQQKTKARGLMQEERKLELNKNREQMEQSVQDELKRMKTYADDLATQLTQKKREEGPATKIATLQPTSLVFTEEKKEPINKEPCGECENIVSKHTLSLY